MGQLHKFTLRKLHQTLEWVTVVHLRGRMHVLKWERCFLATRTALVTLSPVQTVLNHRHGITTETLRLDD